ncbi:hypothetical protein GYMLUDRAFT_218479 [Collybiopsis luxurians FD-317 M1]|nr:hypothetical protein GYMLUDRAFT_218479 [Collybiopsis luxurians FD-317 M1]
MYILLTSLSLTYIGGLVLYRLVFHPLCKCPGPALAALTEGYEAYYNMIKGGDSGNNLLFPVNFLGPVVRVAPNKLHFNYPQAYHDIYTHGSTLTKDPGLYPHGIAAPAYESAWAACDPQKAKFRRSLIAPLFSRRAILELEYTIQQQVNAAIDKLLAVFEEHYSFPGSSVEMSFAYRSLTIDIIMSYCFAESPNTLDYPDFTHPLVRDVEKLFSVFWIQKNFPWIVSLLNNGPEKLLLKLLPQYQGYAQLRGRLARQIDNILSNPDILEAAGHETVYRHLLEPKGRERLSKTALLHDAVVFQAAGSDTVSNVCYVGTFYALKNPEIARKLSQELCEAWPDKDKPLNYAVLEKLPYLTAFIKEALRYSIGVIDPLSRVVGPTSPEVGGLKFPSGTVVEMSSLFNPDVFTDPHEFNPDRWLSGETTNMIQDLVPFSKGARICLVWCELYLIFGNVFRKLNLNLVLDEDSYVPLESFSSSTWFLKLPLDILYSIDEFSPDQRLDYFDVSWRKGYRVAVEKMQV